MGRYLYWHNWETGVSHMEPADVEEPIPVADLFSKSVLNCECGYICTGRQALDEHIRRLHAKQKVQVVTTILTFKKPYAH